MIQYRLTFYYFSLKYNGGKNEVYNTSFEKISII